MSASPHASPDHIDVVALFRSLGRSWHRLAGITLIAGAVSFISLSLIRPTFTSEAQIVVVPRGEPNPFTDPRSVPTNEAVAVRGDREAVNTHAKALQAPELAAKVAADLKLTEKPEFNPVTAGAAGFLSRLFGAGGVRSDQRDEDRVLAALAKRVMVTPNKDSRSISIRVQAKDREVAADIANRLGEAYREQLASRSISESNNVQSGLAPRIERLKQEVAEAEGEVERFRGAANIFRNGGQASSSLNEQQLGELTAAESKAKTELGEVEARARAARELMSRGSIEIHPDVQKSPVIQKLVQDRARIEADLARAGATMKEGHPVVKQLRSEQAATDRQIAMEARRVIDGLEKEVSVASTRLASTQKSLTELKSRVVGTGDDQARLSQLEANAKAKRGELDRLQSQFEANRARSDARVVPMEVQFISQARPAGEPTFPKPLPYTGLVMLATLLLSCSLMIARELIVGARPGGNATGRNDKNAARAQEEQGAPSPFSELGLTEAAVLRANLGEVDTIAALAESLIQGRVEGRARRTLIAGAGVSVDPSADAVELARAIARSGAQTLLIDWSLDGAGIARLLNVAATPGVSEIIDGKSGFEGAISRVPGSAAQLIACGERLVSASARGDADRLNLILDALDEIYDQVLVSARFNAARDLFETVEGRFDCGVLIGDTGRRGDKDEAAPPFLGFETDDLEVLRLTRTSGRKRTTVSREMAA